MLWQASAGLNICFVDYLYPLMCGTWAIVDILRDAFSTGNTTVGSVCLNSGDVNGVEINLVDSRVESCIAFVGLESSATLSQVDEFIIGPSYNYSSDIVFPFKSTKKHNGWAFLTAFSWGVWAAILGVVVTTVAIHLMMRVLKTDSSPVLSHEDTAEIISRSLLSTVGTSRLYDRSVMSRYILSCVIAVFAVVITCLYGSNLVNSFYITATVMPEVTSIHPALRSMVYRGVQVLDVIPNGEFVGTPAVSRVIAKYFNDTFGLATFTEKPVLYQVYITRALAPADVYDILKNVQRRINSRIIDVHSSFERGGTIFKLTLADTWGLFVFLLTGYAVSIAIRVLFTNKKGLCARYTSSGNSPEPSIGFTTPVSGSPGRVIDLPSSLKSPEVVIEITGNSPQSKSPQSDISPQCDISPQSENESQLNELESHSTSGFFDSPVYP